jgi:hypothetical protein
MLEGSINDQRFFGGRKHGRFTGGAEAYEVAYPAFDDMIDEAS